MKNRSNIATALILILVGVWFLAVELNAPLKAFAYGATTWPIPIIGIGALLALLALVLWVPGLWVPACIVAGVGALLLWQNSIKDFGSWAYAWALVPCFAGAGAILAGLFERKRGTVIGGGWTLFSGLVLFAIFGSFLGGSKILATYWPVLVIALGFVLLFTGILRRR